MTREPGVKRGRHTLYRERMKQRGQAAPKDLWLRIDAASVEDDVSSGEEVRRLCIEALDARDRAKTSDVRPSRRGVS